ncbi:glycosyltransferase [Pelagibacterales bacterium SAG-MED47]|nr:glycosyltransferase [Pelagibacterales bacterium SAG-MED47]
MKFSIITVTLNSSTTLRDTLNSVNSQSYKNIEHIIVDGGSRDQTIPILKKYSDKKRKYYIKKNFGIYKSINFGISKATGDFICILHSDDIFQSNETVKELSVIISKNKSFEIFLGNVAYFNKLDYYKITRFYPSKNFQRWKMKFGLMPPHPATIIKRGIYKKNKMYNENFKIAGDFEFFLRLFYINKEKYKVINNTIIRMRSGGISGKNLQSYWISTLEIFRSFSINNLSSNLFFIIMRIPAKISQLFFYSNSQINNKFKLFKINFDKDYYLDNCFKILRRTYEIPYNKNFILSGMNLAFLGYYANRELYPKKTLYHWPDGIWLKRHIDVKKIPGRDLIKTMKLPSNIKKISVLGNLSQNSKNFLIKKFRIKVKNTNLPFGSIDKIIKTKLSLSKDEITFITLPTPKQEKLAYFLAKKNKNYKIVCIGASIAMASGEEKIVPNILKNYEFLWRLRNDFFRRSKRIFETFIYYLKGKYIDKIFHKVRFIKID